MTSASSSGSSRSDSAVDATISQSITVSWRRSAGRTLLMDPVAKDGTGTRPIVLRFPWPGSRSCVPPRAQNHAEMIVEIRNARRLDGGPDQLEAALAQQRGKRRLEHEHDERPAGAALAVRAEEVGRGRFIASPL